MTYNELMGTLNPTHLEFLETDDRFTRQCDFYCVRVQKITLVRTLMPSRPIWKLIVIVKLYRARTLVL